MTLARLSDFLVSAAASAPTFTAAADVATTPVVLQISQNAVR